ncbi:PH domain-containing protein [Rhodococcus sp. G-MC3]|uniref:PH domain-containing protein n=1 Tax=Rhodococcus sp. G-MC3 TaxID=3046209 RepID=UPI0024B9D0CA|nr:PH domain-containing protein [Rhodococcus sp. G-MC3]MDJ0393543.1 PH domain-containing protein [Rhodococcus sp. G-MC3]
MWIKPVDNFSDGPQPVDKEAWATPIAAVVALTVGGFVLVVAAALTNTDPAGRLLISLGAIGLWIIAGLAAYQRPRLWIDAGALSMKRLTGVRTYRRDEIVRIKLVRYPRLGRRVPMLEIDVVRAGDTEDRLIIFGRWDLGTDPQDVYDTLERHGLVPPER